MSQPEPHPQTADPDKNAQASPRVNPGQPSERAPAERPSALNSRFSPLTRRILAVNLLAPALLVAGLFYLGEYRRNLIATELSALRTHAEIFAVALGESAVSEAGQQLLPDLASQIVRRLAFTAETRARLFAFDGSLVADSRILLEPGGQVQAESLPPPTVEEESDGVLTTLFYAFDTLYTWLPGTDEYPPYSEKVEQRAQDYREAMGALDGETWVARRSMPDGSLVLSVAMPVTRYKQTLGVLMLSKSSLEIDAALFDVRLEILRIFAFTLMITVLMSFYLAGTIARPIRILARAADRVRKGQHRQHTIPGMRGRNDEIGELAIALNDMTEALWTRMDAIEAFAADVSHEIKNPLTSLKSAVETAARLKDPDQQRKLMAVIQDDVERLDRLISDISDASRLDAELSRAETLPVDLGKMLSTLADIHSHTTSAGAPQLVVDVQGTVQVIGMEDRLVQVFRNLITNAVSFSPPSGAVIRLGAHRNNGSILITVEDQGPGIPPGKEIDIFNRFYTERPEAEQFGRHSGLGLAISKQIIEAHGGTIVAETLRNENGKALGAQFTVRLPAA
ncbi:stimulus-sensing domain-containing protein [Magnetovibrio blakemorei]|uniref:stimulus-sensing domain-containing protein n=1 Tax=Magnetovibrio blakemorei TaxID=28181 RepID=UPI000A042B3A|nr:stimulus-sensing domain-containing protein [Magnetovibrio blakemorei]